MENGKAHYFLLRKVKKKKNSSIAYTHTHTHKCIIKKHNNSFISVGEGRLRKRVCVHTRNIVAEKKTRKLFTELSVKK